mmetsp:Transcript_35837/g.91560  ORF Transcript_35837/g.91560 Transcript_35837/m.91560 type:complete len:208 (-) Transcript_35837:1191-1814(-)
MLRRKIGRRGEVYTANLHIDGSSWVGGLHRLRQAQIALDVLQLQDVPSQEVAMTLGHICLGDDDHLTASGGIDINIEVDVARVGPDALSGVALAGPLLLARLQLQRHHVRADGALICVHERSQLGQRDARVQLQVLLDGRQVLLLPDLGQEQLQLLQVRRLVGVKGILEVRRARCDKLRAGVGKQLVIHRLCATGHLRNLLIVLLAQ